MWTPKLQTPDDFASTAGECAAKPSKIVCSALLLSTLSRKERTYREPMNDADNVSPSVSLGEDLSSSSYRVVRRLAKGGMGEVFVVEHKELGTELVMKVIRSQLPEFEEELTRRLRTEARMMVAMTHVNLVRVTDFGFTRSGRAYLVTELLEGETLGAYANRLGTVPLREAVEITSQMLRGLGFVHARGLVHRDIKPDNIFLASTPGGPPIVKILDFGIAKLQSAEAKARMGVAAQSTKEGTVLGTPKYFAPEQAMARPVDARTDLYSAACVFYRLVAGRPPFLAEQSSIELYEKHILETPHPPSAYAPRPLGLAVDAFVLRALAKKKEERYASADEMLAALDTAVKLSAGQPTVPYAATASPLPGVPLTALAPNISPPARVSPVSTAPSAATASDGDTVEGTVFKPGTAARYDDDVAQEVDRPRRGRQNLAVLTAPTMQSTTSLVAPPAASLGPRATAVLATQRPGALVDSTEQLPLGPVATPAGAPSFSSFWGSIVTAKADSSGAIEARASSDTPMSSVDATQSTLPTRELLRLVFVGLGFGLAVALVAVAAYFWGRAR